MLPVVRALQKVLWGTSNSEHGGGSGVGGQRSHSDRLLRVFPASLNLMKRRGYFYLVVHGFQEARVVQGYNTDRTGWIRGPGSSDLVEPPRLADGSIGGGHECLEFSDTLEQIPRSVFTIDKLLF